MKTVDVPRWLFVPMLGCTITCLVVGCVSVVSWMVTGEPDPSTPVIRHRQMLPPAVHRTTQSPIPLTGGDPELIPPTNLPER